MEKRVGLLVILSAFTLYLNAQSFSTREWNTSVRNKPLIFYITGDGGFNKFSDGFCKRLNQNGFDVVALDAKSYFWKRKTPEQTTGDISDFLLRKMEGRDDQQIVLIGYSFGADVLPFVLNRLPASIREKVQVSFIVESSGSTDFEIHVLDMFGAGKKRGIEVLPEVNRLHGYKIVTISSSDGEGLDAKRITVPNSVEVTLPGGHHFDDKSGELATVVEKYIR